MYEALPTISPKTAASMHPNIPNFVSSKNAESGVSAPSPRVSNTGPTNSEAGVFESAPSLQTNRKQQID